MLPNAVVAGCLLVLATWRAALSEELTIFAGASLTDAVTEISEIFEQMSGHSVTPVFASSSTLARQIENGAPAHIFISANGPWMDYLADRDGIDDTTRTDVVSNALVLIAPTNDAQNVVHLDQLPSFLEDRGQLAIGDPDHVPAGIYARQTLTSLGLWDQLAPRVVRTGNVRATLALVERGEALAGIVYVTDATLSEDVVIVAELPVDSHQLIVYPAAALANLGHTEREAAEDYLQFLASDDAQAIFLRHGFTPLTND